jgi:hypothetical protein
MKNLIKLVLASIEKFFMNPFNYGTSDESEEDKDDLLGENNDSGYPEELDSSQLSLHEFLQTENGQRAYKAGYQAMEFSFSEGHSYLDSSYPSGSLEYEAFHEGVKDAYTVRLNLGKTQE